MSPDAAPSRAVTRPPARPARDAAVTTSTGATTADAVLGALGDATRRSLLQAVAEQGPLTPTELAGPAGISRQAVSKHLGVLEQAGLVRADRVGREARYTVVAGSLEPASDWLERVGTAWDDRLGRLRRHLGDG